MAITRTSRRLLSSLTVCLASSAVAACGDDPDAGKVVQTNDETPPSALTMDAHFTRRDGQGVLVTVTPTSGNQLVTLDNLPAITLLVRAEDHESAVADLRIVGETTVNCVGEELGQQKHASWLQPALATAQPKFTRYASLVVALGRQHPNDRPGADFIAHCPPDMKLTSVSGEFHASATNGVNQTVRTGLFSFRWLRPT